MRCYWTLCLVTSVALLSGGRTSANCLAYGGQVHLQGTLSFREYPGPPNYDNKSPPITVWVVTVSEPLCVDVDPDAAARSVNVAAKDLSEIQTIPAYPPGAGAFRLLRDKPVQLSGVLHGRMGRDQKTPVVLTDARIEQPDKAVGK